MASAVIALLLDNSRLGAFYDALLDTPVSVRVGTLAIDKTLLPAINDGLMAVFFLLVALELKRGIVVGELSTREHALLPLIAAIGGMAALAAVYSVVNLGNPAALRGWAIPTATDIAFALAVLSMLGSSVPVSVRAFLLAFVSSTIWAPFSSSLGSTAGTLLLRHWHR